MYLFLFNMQLKAASLTEQILLILTINNKSTFLSHMVNGIIFFVVLTPVLMNILDKRGFIRRYPWANAPIQTLFCGLCLTFATPMCCALFSQRASIAVNQLEPELQVCNLPNRGQTF